MLPPARANPFAAMVRIEIEPALQERVRLAVWFIYMVADRAGTENRLDLVMVNRVGGRFDLQHRLKQGNGIETYAGVDTADGSAVVVKTVATTGVSAALRLRLEHEAHVLERLGTDTFRPLVASGYDHGRFYLVQPRIAGESLADRLARGPLPLTEALRVATDVLQGLQLAHDQGVIHRDVKPANIIVTAGADNTDGPAARAVLIDFGLARSAGLDASLRDEPVGTARYLAPEAAGLIESGVDHRSDLYAVGVVLFECLAGQPPFTGETVGEVLRQHLNTAPPALRAFGVDVPRAIDAVVQRLLAKEPAERYQSAAAVLADLAAIQEQLAAGVAEPAVMAGAHDRRRSLTEPSFVGRAAELAALGATLDGADRGEGGLVLVEAESGGGKTRLLDELALQAQRQGFWVLRGQGVDHAAHRPFQVLDGVVSGIAASAATGPSPRHLRARLGDWAEAVAVALPDLAEVLGTGRDGDDGPEAYGETRSLDALTVLLDVLGRPARPALILLDDCQWADGLTVKLLAQWQAQLADRAADTADTADSPDSTEPGTAGGGGVHVLVVAAFRSEEVTAGHPLRAIEPLRSVRLSPFGPDDVAALCASMAGPLPAEAVATVVRLVDGSPFMASAVLRGMVETGALYDTPTGWAVDPGPMGDVQTSRRAAVFLARRFELLDLDARRLLTVGAVLGKEFDLDLAVALTGQGASQVAPALTEARRRRILWIDEDDGRCSFTHDKLRETLLGRLEPAERRMLHRRAAELIERRDPDRVFELAYHFDAAGEPTRALPYALRSAELARGRHALDVALTHYRIAERAAAGGDDAGSGDGNGEDHADATLRARIAEGLGDVLTLKGDYGEATRQFNRALSLCPDTVGRAVLDGKLGDVAFKTGDPTLARRHLERALHDLGGRVPRPGIGMALAAVKEVLVQALHTLLPRLFLARRRRDDPGADREFLAIRLYSRLAYVYWFCAGKVPCAWAHLREMNLAERYPPTPELAQAYSEHAPVMTMAPWYSRGLRYAERSLAIRREFGDVWGQGQSHGFCGVVLYAGSRYRETIDHAREAVRLLERTGDRWEQHTALWHLVFAHHRLGELGTAVELARQLHASATAIGDQAAAGIVLSGWARAAAGAVPAEAVAAELARDNDDAHTSAEVRVADAVRLLAAGDVDAAVARLEEAAAIAAAAGLRQEYVAPIGPWLATALRLRLEAADPHDRRGRRRRLRRAGRVARRAVRLARAYRNNLPHALRERALVASLQGRARRADRLLARSLAVAAEQGAAYEVVLTRVAAARLAVARGRPGAAEDLAAAEADRAALEPLPPDGGADGRPAEEASWSLADRFESLLAVSRSIGAAPSPVAIYAAVREASVLLLRGDRCHVIEVDPAAGPSGTEPRLVTESGDPVGGISRTLLAEAIEGRAPVVAGAGEDGDSGESLLLAGLRSALCAPIVSDGRVVACLYVTHRQVGDLFGDLEVRLAEFLATLAGAALEHVAGSEARFRSLAQNSSDVITIVGADGRVTYQSESMLRVFGYRPEDFVGRELAPQLHPEHSAALLAVLESPPAEGETAGLVTTKLRHRDGRWRDVEIAVTTLYDDPGVRGLVLNTRDVTERVALEAELRKRAWHDPLTGLANRALFTDRVDHALALRARDGRPLAVAFLDLDDFKSINDTLGHTAGDLLLQGIGERLTESVRPGDTVARFGGDEFALLFEGADARTAERIAKRIIAGLLAPFRILDEEVHARASIGVALAEGDETTDELLSGADTAMYVAKARGKSRFEFFEPTMRAVAVERSGLRTDLEWALPRDELVIHYQPVVDVPTGVVQGFEALLRWQHPKRGLLSPGEFIDLAEETGLIVSIGSWVLRRACEQAVRWRRRTGRDLTMAVNVSARQLQDPGLVGEIGAALAAAGLEPAALVLEITESATVSDTEGVIARLEELKALGVGLAIDDFGTGYSSLSYLRRFPVDQLKIDRSFVAGVATNGEDRAIAGSVIGLAHALGIHVVAEGVQTVEQLEWLSELRCDLAQGFNWLRPAPAPEIDRWPGLLARPAVMALLSEATPSAAKAADAAVAARSMPHGDVRVLVADDRDSTRAVLRTALDIEAGFAVVGDAANAEGAIHLAEQHQPDLILLDVAMPGTTGIDALPALRQAAPAATIVLLTALDPATVSANGGSAADAILDKTCALGDLVTHLEAFVSS
jgi:diguanylate cyclase (GGDEF)-like protein/PAS domain S-box-containing protein